MKWYPWLNAPYKKILSHYQKGRGHHALLLHTQPGNGDASLCYAISRWLMCCQPNGIKSCKICHNCQLMMVNNHPDFYKTELQKGEQTVGVCSIHDIFNRIYNHAHQGGTKVVLMLNVENLTEQAANALLKTLEEPPDQTYFLLVCETPARLLPTLRSRCLYYLLPTPNEALSLCWLKQAGFNDQLSACTALRLCSNAPLAAEKLLQPVRWKARMTFCIALKNALNNCDFLSMLPALNCNKDDNLLHWLLSLLADALKWQEGAQEFLVNADSTSLIATLATCCSSSVLHEQWQQWLLCFRQFQEIHGINRELLLTYYLLNWENNMTHTHISQ